MFIFSENKFLLYLKKIEKKSYLHQQSSKNYFSIIFHFTDSNKSFQKNQFNVVKIAISGKNTFYGFHCHFPIYFNLCIKKSLLYVSVYMLVYRWDKIQFFASGISLYIHIIYHIHTNFNCVWIYCFWYFSETTFLDLLLQAYGIDPLCSVWKVCA